MRAVAISILLLVAQGIDLGPLLRNLFDGRSADKPKTSKAIRLEDAESGRRARLLLVDEGNSPLLVLQFEPAHERLLPHTVRLHLDDEAETLRVMELQLSRDHGEPEVVVTLLPPEQLERLAQASRAGLTLEGWDETFAATLDEKDLGKVSKFWERRDDDD